LGQQHKLTGFAVNSHRVMNPKKSHANQFQNFRQSTFAASISRRQWRHTLRMVFAGAINRKSMHGSPFAKNARNL
jgi:hypothetical protein